MKFLQNESEIKNVITEEDVKFVRMFANNTWFFLVLVYDLYIVKDNISDEMEN